MATATQKKESAIAKLSQFALERSKATYPNVPEYAIPRPRYTDRTSNGLTKCIVDCLNLCGYQAERINSTGRQITIDGTTKWVKGSTENGTADISATIKGRSVKIEVKCKATKDNCQSQDQKDYQRKIEQAGGVYVIARDFEGFYTWFKTFIKKTNGQFR